MSQNLLINMFYAAPELWYSLAFLFVVLVILLFYASLIILKLKQKNYFANRESERLAEVLYASKDGYFSFIYPDDKIDDPRKKIVSKCSRRLAVLLNLENGIKASFDDVLKAFYKDDAKKIAKYTDLLRDEGCAFDDVFTTKSGGRILKLSGARICDAEGHVFCDMIWFRDISDEITKIDELQANCKKTADKTMLLSDLIDHLAYPAWLRDEHQHLKFVNKPYLDFVSEKNRETVLNQGIEILATNNESVSFDLALAAHATNKIRKQKISLVKNGVRHSFEVTETPFHAEQNLDIIYSVGSMVDVTELDELKRNLKLHQNAHLEILGALGTAFAVFDAKKRLAFYNKSFAKMWQLEPSWLDAQPPYSAFLDEIRERRLLPEVPDFILYKKGEQDAFSSILEAREDLLHLPDGRTLRRVRAQHPMGGLFFAFEDVTDRLATRRAYNDLISIQKEILDNLSEAVMIFTPNGRLSLYNKAYMELWGYKEIFLQNDPSLQELIEAAKDKFPLVDNWENLRNDIVSHITNATTKTFRLNRVDGLRIEVTSVLLADGSFMIINKQVL